MSSIQFSSSSFKFTLLLWTKNFVTVGEGVQGDRHPEERQLKGQGRGTLFQKSYWGGCKETLTKKNYGRGKKGGPC